jgi:hypothetical protein
MAQGNTQVVTTNTTSLNLCNLVDGGTYTIIMNGLTAGSTITVNGYQTYNSSSSCSTQATVDLGAGATTFVAQGATTIVSFVYTTRMTNGNTLYGNVATNFNAQ